MKIKSVGLFVMLAFSLGVFFIPNNSFAGRENGVWFRSTWEFPDLEMEERPVNMAEINGELMDSDDLIKNLVLGAKFGFTQDKDRNFKYIDPYLYIKIFTPLQLGVRYYADSLSDTGFVGASGRMVKDIEFGLDNRFLLFGEITGYSEVNDEKEAVNFTTGNAEIAFQFSSVRLGADYIFRMDDYENPVYRNYFGGKIGVEAKGILFFVAGGKNYVKVDEKPDTEYSVVYVGIEMGNKPEPKRYKFFWEYYEDEKKDHPQRSFPERFTPKETKQSNKDKKVPACNVIEEKELHDPDQVINGNGEQKAVIDDPEELECTEGAEKINYKAVW